MVTVMTVVEKFTGKFGVVFFGSLLSAVTGEPAAAVFLSETQLETDRLLGQKRDLQVQIAGIRDEMNSLNNQATALRDESNSCIPGIEHHNHYINHECNKIACERVIDDNF